MLYELEIWNKLTAKEMEWIKGETEGSALFGDAIGPIEWGSFQEALEACQRPKKEGGGCSNSKRSQVVADLVKSIKNPPHSLNDSPAWISWAEEKYLGTSITCNKVDGCSDSVKSNTTCKEFVDGKNGFMVFCR